MTQESLLNYIRTEVLSGQHLDSIASLLLQQGYSQQQINEAYTQLGYFKSNQVTAPSTPLRNKQRNLFPVAIALLALFVLVILGTFAFSNKKNKKTLNPLPTTSQITQATQTLPNCSDPSHWSTSVETTFNAATYLKPASVTTCEYTDSLLGYTVQYPANWYVIFNPSQLAAQPYNFISFDSQQLSAPTSSPLSVSISLRPSKTTYSDIISYMESIQEGPGKSYQSDIEKNVYHPISVAGQKAVQLQYTLGNSVGIDTKFISNGVLYDVTFNGTSLNAINANKQNYTNFLNSFTLKPTQ
jgi:hypothetical protein